MACTSQVFFSSCRRTIHSFIREDVTCAGGYDARLAENVEHLHELKELARSEGISSNVTFVPSFSDEQRAGLLAGCVAVLYTPQARPIIQIKQIDCSSNVDLLSA